jgi:Subtilase family/PKD domain/Secretion system C-terminal sorting domain
VRILPLIFSMACLSGMAQGWEELKASIKAISDKDKRSLQSARVNWPLQFSDSNNHFLMRAVHPSGTPIYLTTLNANAAITTGTALLQNGNTGFVLTGEGQHLFQWDAGAVQAHIEFGNRVVANEGVTTDRHATHVAGTLIASGFNPQVRGMSPAASLHAYYFDDDIFEIATQSEKNQYGFLISNHSYGTATGWNRVGNAWQWLGDELVSSDEDFTAGLYSVRAKQIDDIAFLSPYHTIVWAAGNDRADTGNGSHPADCNGGLGYDCIVQEATAKNIITVGGVDQVLNYTGPSSVPMPGFSSWGPTDDGRIKPDLVADGASVLSTTNAGVDQYTTLGGTSMATANVSGSLLLLQELYGKLNGGRWMRAATLKALAIHTTKETGSAPGPDYSFGWGLLDVAEAARVLSKRDDINTFVVEGELLNDAVHEWILSPQANQKITATLVWADPSGLSPGALLDAPYKMLINDLDLKIIDDNGATQYPWILNPDNPSGAAAHGDNTRDNVEKIEFNLPAAKPYRLRLSHKGYLVNGSQQYSLIITYTSTSAAKTLYWVGGSGNWNDGAHWSLTSGGSPINAIPGSNDRVIVDENSFTTSGDISLSVNVACQTMRWYCTKVAGINFNGMSLTIGKELTIASGGFRKLGDGKFNLSTSSMGVLNADGGPTSPANFDFTSGAWTVFGDLVADTILISGGSVLLDGTTVSVNHFLGLGNASQLQTNEATIQVANSWKSDETKTSITSLNSTIVANGSNVLMQANNLNWASTLVNNGSMTISGNVTFDSLYLEPGSTLTLNANTALNVNGSVYFHGESGSLTTLTSSGIAAMYIRLHGKFCTDYVSVSNINLTGNAVWNVGPNSSIQNAMGWQQQSCEDVVFPDFEFRYACANAITEFTNISSGSIDSYHWDFGDIDSGENESAEQNPTHQFSAMGDYIVTLTVISNGISYPYSSSITILPNTLPLTTVEYSSENLFSSVEANSYQWFANDQLLEGETNRFYGYAGVEGYYRVVLYDDHCNSPSEWLAITGLGAEEQWAVYPNPATNRLFVSIPGAESLEMKDCLGHTLVIPWNSTEAWVDVSTLNNGLYVLVVKKSGGEITRRIWINK